MRKVLPVTLLAIFIAGCSDESTREEAFFNDLQERQELEEDSNFGEAFVGAAAGAVVGEVVSEVVEDVIEKKKKKPKPVVKAKPKKRSFVSKAIRFTSKRRR